MRGEPQNTRSNKLKITAKSREFVQKDSQTSESGNSLLLIIEMMAISTRSVQGYQVFEMAYIRDCRSQSVDHSRVIKSK